PEAATGRIDVLVAPVRSLLQPLTPGLGDLEPVELRAGDSAELDAVGQRLVDAAYSRVELVEKRGEFAVRGGLLDVFPPTEPHPVRVEFWGDEVDELRWLPVPEASALVTHPHDAAVLTDLARTDVPRTPTLVLVRHASAGERADFDGPDDLRPLDGRGRAQADRLAQVLTAFAPT
ncbi:transcription-repair coupling factor, partial [Curtobacterium sp. P97]|nr:transcription-repair coupling factor [Curtobacterium sp. P97]